MSSPIARKREDACKKVIEQLGYKPLLADNISTNYGGYMAGTGIERANWINKMFADKEVKGIFCVRGGESGTRVMPYVDFEMIKNNPKVFMGFSDITCMHNALNNICDMVTFHGPMVTSNMTKGLDKATEEGMFRAINAIEDFDFVNPEDEDIEVLNKGEAEGILTGGNLGLVATSIGTKYETVTKDRILFLEDVDLTLNWIERFAYQLKNSGKLDEVKGILLGQFTNCPNPWMDEYDEIKLFTDVLEGMNIPVMYNLQAGHGKTNVAMPFGANCKINTEDRSIRFSCHR